MAVHPTVVTGIYLIVVKIFYPELQMSSWSQRKSLGITKVNRIHPLVIMKFDGDASNSC